MQCWSMGYSVDGSQAGEENNDSGGQVERVQRDAEVYQQRNCDDCSELENFSVPDICTMANLFLMCTTTTT